MTATATCRTLMKRLMSYHCGTPNNKTTNLGGCYHFCCHWGLFCVGSTWCNLVDCWLWTEKMSWETQWQHIQPIQPTTVFWDERMRFRDWRRLSCTVTVSGLGRQTARFPQWKLLKIMQQSSQTGWDYATIFSNIVSLINTTRILSHNQRYPRVGASWWNITIWALFWSAKWTIFFVDHAWIHWENIFE